MWTPHSTSVADGRALRFTIESEAGSLSYAEALRLWREDAAFRAAFTAMLADAPFTAYRWETPPLTESTSDRPFEFVLLDSPGLAGPPDPGAFAEHFGRAPRSGVAVFPNLGEDALMVVPCPGASPRAYGHLAAFVRHAPEPQRHALWKAVGATMKRRLGARPVWLSTAGGGVPWLHVRLDDRPKYYGYGPYRDPARRDRADEDTKTHD